MLGWAQNPSFAFDMKGDIRTSFFNEKILIGLGRQDRELAAMDNGSSLVLNRSALPFLAMDMAFRPVSWLQFTTITGILEFPNKAYLYEYDEENEPSKLRNYNREDSYMFQNAYSVEMIDLDFKFFHFDVGSACVWPKRFELGYFFPFITNVVYQNYIGDYDNLCLFGDCSLRKSVLGKIWISGYLDEMPTVNPKYLFKKTRYMFSMQGGAKWEIPFLPFANLSLRYTRVEPYCYTHDSIKNTPWYNDYISESYTNGGESLGYYLAPNSDEILVRFEMKPLSNLETALQYQLIRHGADFGSQQVQGSSLYSELVYMYGRGDKYKYFLKDGAYEWSNIITLSGSCNLNSYGIPASLNLCAGYVYDYFTDNEGDVGECSQYHKIETKEYNTTNGFVFSIGFKAFCK